MKQILHKYKENYDDNKLIRKFMEGNDVIIYNNYHLDWNALMPVARKIVTEFPEYDQLDRMEQILNALMECDIDELYQTVVGFIKYTQKG